MHDARFVRRGHGYGDPPGDGGGARGRQPSAVQHRAQRQALEQLHHEERPTVGQTTEVGDAHQAGMRHARSGAGLAQETLADLGIIRQIAAQRFHGERPTER